MFKKLKTLACLSVILAFAGTTVSAATMSYSASAPAVDAWDIAYLSTGASTDAKNLNGGDDAATYIAGNRPPQGQTFTTGTYSKGYLLNSVTLRNVSYASAYDVTYGTMYVRVGTFDTNTFQFTVIASETANPNAATGTTFGSGTYVKWTFATPVALQSNTVYAFDVFSDGGYFEVDASTNNNAYSSGRAFSTGLSTWTGDRVFHVDLVTNSVPYSSSGNVTNVASLRPTTQPVATVNLAGTWNFTPQGQSQTTIQVPGGGWYKQGFTSISEADYSTNLTIPNIGQPQATWLEFGAANYEADVYINNTPVGTNIQSFTPASFDLSSFVTPGNTYALRVHVKGRNAFMSGGKSLVPNAAGWSSDTPQGIFRSAELKIYPQVYISDVFVKPSVSGSSLYYDVSIRNASSTATNVTLSGNLSSWNGAAWSYPALPSRAISLAAGASTNITVGPVNWNLGTGSYWWPNVPYQPGYQAQLHNLNLSLAPTGGGAVIHTNSTRFGFRECRQGPDGLGNTVYFLNGIRVNFRGDNLQGADYDNIIYNGGRGDAYGTLPGFLPPSPGNPGWPQAVDNYQRLNYNVNRIHQEPCTPYMLDVCDEMGFMIIQETAIRGSGDDQNFIAGHDNMVNHLKALYTRDRNHASIVRQSLDNEPDQSSTDSTAFQIDLYNAAMSVDGTRPLSVDPGGTGQSYDSLTYSNFSAYRHYVGSGNPGVGWYFSAYTDEVIARSDRPYGQGEYIWSADNTAQGLTWFGTSCQAMRAKGASDTRPYTLLSAWASVIPGVNRTAMVIEQGGNPRFGEDNLPDPWNNSIIQRVQAGFNPVLVADSSYWESAKVSNANGDWPASVPTITPAQAMTRTLTLYNDTFSGTAVDVFWEFRQNSVAGPIVSSGVVNATVPLGYTQTTNITINTPNAPDGTIYYLVLYSKKNGVELFRENSQQFVMLNATKLAGTAFGTTPAWATGSEYGMAFDSNLSTFFDYSQANGGYTGIDLGSGNSKAVSRIVYTPRSGFEDRMPGGVFEGSVNGTSYTTIHTISATPSGTTTVVVNGTQAYQYLRYRGPNGSYCNVAEIEFYNAAPNAFPTTPTNLVSSVSGAGLNLAWPSNYKGWWLQVQTNSTGLGLGTNWFLVPGSCLTNQLLIPADRIQGSVFYRLAAP